MHSSKTCLSWFVLAVSALVSAVAVADDSKSSSEFVSMFDGKSLSGWSVSTPRAAKAWYVEDGMIVGEGDKGRSYLVYDKKDIADFEMKFTYRFPGKGNSGVNIRSKVDETGRRDFQSYHVDIGQVGIGKQVLGAWDFTPRAAKSTLAFVATDSS